VVATVQEGVAPARAPLSSLSGGLLFIL